VADLVEEPQALWTTPIADREAAEAAFGRVYADPVVVDGAAMSVADLVQRVAARQPAFAGLTMQILDRVVAGDLGLLTQLGAVSLSPTAG